MMDEYLDFKGWEPFSKPRVSNDTSFDTMSANVQEFAKNEKSQVPKLLNHDSLLFLCMFVKRKIHSTIPWFFCTWRREIKNSRSQ